MTPKRQTKGKSRAVANELPSTSDAAEVETSKVLAKWYHSFQSVKRSIRDEIIRTLQFLLSQLASWQRSRKSSVTQKASLNFLFKSTMGANTELAPYLAFKGVLEMNSHINIIALVAYEAFVFSDKNDGATNATMVWQTDEQAVGQDLAFQKFIQPLNENLESLLENPNGIYNRMLRLLTWKKLL
ncbi:hypothetical protein FSPOR_3109 [Fusarium sporotrichioides]|uniref:Uncharacterized protein n=1 Tax=Fusarium sporotrichioides TaxID=5514 RepID=A0A395SH29_FUSSP|nr:hypothetical protein FSPOR_3109 [Fusarium sporotrichioides]